MPPTLKLSLERNLLLSTPLLDGASLLLTATSGIVKVAETYYVVSDHEFSLFSFNEKDSALSASKLIEGKISGSQEERKKSKADFESLFSLSPLQWPPFGAIVAWPSGSNAMRMTSVIVPFDEKGKLAKAIPTSIVALADKMKDSAKELNMEGVLIKEGKALVFQRGNKGNGRNGIFEIPLVDFLKGLKDALWNCSVKFSPYEIGTLNGVKLSVTDAINTKYGILALAAAEDNATSIADGKVKGSVLVNFVKDKAQILAHFDHIVKLEGLVVDKELEDGSLSLLFVEDADDTTKASRLFRAHLTADFFK